MSKTIKYKLFLDLAMTVLYLLLMFGYKTGALFHEIAGIGILLLFSLHLLLNRKEFLGLLRIGSKMQNSRKVFQCLSDLVLILGMPVTILTGALISQRLFGRTLQTSVLAVHNFSAYLCLSVLLLHLLTHVRYLLFVCIRRFRGAGQMGTVRLAERAFAFSAAVCFLYLALSGAFTKSIGSSLISVASSTANTAIVSSSAGKKEEDISASIGSDSTADVPSLSEHLGKLYCTGCHRHCSLLNPLCAKGQTQAEQAEIKYSEQYSLVED
jgi:hypothetical protein